MYIHNRPLPRYRWLRSGTDLGSNDVLKVKILKSTSGKSMFYTALSFAELFGWFDRPGESSPEKDC